MNRISLTSFLFIVITLIFSACTHNQSLSPHNSSKIDHKIFELSNGFSNPMLDYSEGLYDVQLMLNSEGIVFDQAQQSFNEKRDIVLFRVYTPDLNEIPDGTYTFDNRNPQVNSFNYGNAYTEFEADKESKHIMPLAVIGGQINIQKLAHNYQIVFNIKLKDKNGIENSFSGKYTGTIQKVNFNH